MTHAAHANQTQIRVVVQKIQRVVTIRQTKIALPIVIIATVVVSMIPVRTEMQQTLSAVLF